MSNRREFLKSSTAFMAAVAAIQHKHLLACEEIARWDTSRLREQYLLQPGLTYLNHASIGTIPKSVHEARHQYVTLCESNPWLYLWGGDWEQPREQVRQRAAAFLTCEPSQVAITHNTTELFNVLAHGVPWRKDDEVLWCSLAHAGSTIPFQQQSARLGFTTRSFSLPMSGVRELTAAAIVDLYASQIRDSTRVLVLPHVDNTIGLRQSVREIADLARDRGVEIIGVDAAQTVGMMPVNISSWNVDAVGMSPHKWLQSPKGIGLAYIGTALQESLQPMWTTWGQQQWSASARKYEDYGTRNMPELLALGDAIEFHKNLGVEKKEKRLRELFDHAKTETRKRSTITWNSPDRWELGASLYSIGIDGDSGAVARQLFKEHQIVVRPFTVGGRGALRVSPNLINSEAEIDRLLDVIG